jgi:transcriptional regulator
VPENGQVYVPRFNALDAVPEMQALVMQVGSAQLITTGADGYPLASMLPVIWEPAGSRLVMHMAKANQHWKAIEPDTPALAVVTGPEAYVSPAWYATKAEHGKVVPTWNYSAVHLRGPVTVHDDPEWLRQAVTRLTDHHEARTADGDGWRVDDAPARFVDGQLKAIVGVSMVVTDVDAKAKLSQNRSDADQAGVVDGLAQSADLGAAAVRAAMLGHHDGH